MPAKQGSPARAKARSPRQRLLFLANTSWYLWNFRLRLAQHLAGQGYEIVFAAPPDDYSHRLAASGEFVPFGLSRSGRNPFRELGTVLRMVRLLEGTRPGMVLTWTPKPNIYGGIAGRILGVPAIPNVTGLGHAFTAPGPLPRLIGRLYRLAFRRCPTVFFQNSQDRRRFVEEGWAMSHAARLLPGSGVDLNRFRPQPLRRAGDFVFLFVGRLLYDKGLRELVAATGLLRQGGLPIRVRVLGFLDPRSPSAVEDQEVHEWERRGIVDYLGSSDDVEHHIAQADCIVLPSRYREGLPRVLLEAAACARPVITTDTPGCRDAVEDRKTGFLCRPQDVPSLLDAMRRMMALSPAEREAMGRAGRAKMEQGFSEDIVFAAYEAALKDVLGTRRGGASVAAVTPEHGLGA
jgi:glycosyltransferase involved in cell wall biosynthesis